MGNEDLDTVSKKVKEEVQDATKQIQESIRVLGESVTQQFAQQSAQSTQLREDMNSRFAQGNAFLAEFTEKIESRSYTQDHVNGQLHNRTSKTGRRHAFKTATEMLRTKKGEQDWMKRRWANIYNVSQLDILSMEELAELLAQFDISPMDFKDNFPDRRNQAADILGIICD